MLLRLVSLFVPAPITRLALTVLRRHLSVWRKYLFASVVGNFGEPLIYLLGFGFGMARFVDVGRFGGMPYQQWLAPGLMVSAAMFTASLEGTFGSYTRLYEQKTFESIVATPVSIEEVATGDWLFATVKAAIASTVVTLVAAALGLVSGPWLLFCPLVGLLTGATFAGISLATSAVAKSYETFNYFFTLFVTPVFLFSGVFYPLDGLPPWARSVAWFLPLSHSVALTRGLCFEGPQLSMLGDIAWLAGAALLFYVPAINLIARRIIK